VRVLVTGGAGFVGASVSVALAQRHLHVYGVEEILREIYDRNVETWTVAA
jgi:nucleoside-diphosphate-sugar epimerase